MLHRTIDDSAAAWTIYGKAVALHGRKVSCGATLIASTGNFTRG
jgi:uncharacterized Zn-binding protein involved in type VI secretion